MKFGRHTSPANNPPQALIKKLILSPVSTESTMVISDVNAMKLASLRLPPMAIATMIVKAGKPTFDK